MADLQVKQHDDGTWYARPYMGMNMVTGKPWRPYRRFPEAGSEAEALEMARDWAESLAGAAGVGASTRLVDVLMRYVDSLESGGEPANTVRAYRGALERYVVPNVGYLEVDEFRPHLVESLYAVVMARGGRDGAPVSAATVLQLHWFLCGAFKWIVRNEVSPFDPMPSVRKPRADAPEAMAFDEAQFSAIQTALARIMDEPDAGASRFRRTVAMAAYLALWTGVRCGEACALTWSDVREAQGTVHVAATVVEPRGAGPSRQPRTKGGRGRNVSVTAEVADRLRSHDGWQRSWLPPCAPPRDRRTVLCSKQGGLLRPSRVSAGFSALRGELGLPEGATFHALRHTHATWLLYSGVDMRTVQERLGHANVATTLALYGHVLPGRDRAAADAFSSAARAMVDEIEGHRGPLPTEFRKGSVE